MNGDNDHPSKGRPVWVDFPAPHRPLKTGKDTASSWQRPIESGEGDPFDLCKMQRESFSAEC